VLQDAISPTKQEKKQFILKRNSRHFDENRDRGHSHHELLLYERTASSADSTVESVTQATTAVQVVYHQCYYN